MSEATKPADCGGNCESCGADCSSRQQDMHIPLNQYSTVRKVIGIVSGKGGVGKSLVTSLTACAMQSRGYATAVFDADVTGPSIPKAFGITEKAKGNELGLLPEKSKMGIEVMSVNLLLEDDEAPGGMARPGDLRCNPAILDGRCMGRYRLYVHRYAARNGRRAADRISIPPA